MNFQSRFSPYSFPSLGYIKLPSIVLNEEELSLVDNKNISNDEFLKTLIKRGFISLLDKGIISKDKKNIYLERIKMEFNTFTSLGFVNYVLLVNRVIRFCENNKIVSDWGRGSAAGSLIFFCLGITGLDPIRYGFFFERFLSATRAKVKEINGEILVDGGNVPDVDINVDPTRRQEVLDYLGTLYEGKICKILNMSELTGKILIKECGKIVGDKPEWEMTEVSNLIPKIFGVVSDLEKAYEESPDFKKWCEQNKRIYDISLKLRNLYKNSSIHASGYVISEKNLLEIMPICLSSEGEIASCYTMNDVSSIAIKLDILGSRCSTVIDSTCKMLNLNWREINVDSDENIYNNLKNGLKHKIGIFQLEADCAFRVCNEVKPKNLLELSAVSALARPGALAWVDKYVKNENVKVHPLFDPILEKTRFVCLYQETMMQMAVAIGFTLSEANTLRKIVGKKLVNEVAEWKDKIYEKCKTNQHPLELGDLLWKILSESASYSFNFSHSASYSALTACTVFLKYKYPLQFFTALLNEAKNEADSLNEIYLIQSELSDFGIRLLPPSLELSDINFSIEGNNIRYGLGCLKGLSNKTLEKLLTFKKKYNNRFEIFEAAEQSKINIGILSSLIQSGCLEHKEERSAMVYEAQLYRLLTEKERLIVHQLIKTVPGDLRDIIQFMIANKNDKGKPLIKESRVDTLKKRAKKYREIFEQNKKNERLAIYYYELKNIGYPYTYSLKSVDPEYEHTFQNITEIKRNCDENEQVRGLFELSEVYKGKGRKSGKMYVKFSLRDETGSIDGLAFNSDRSQNVDWIIEDNGGKLPAKGDIVFIKGKKKDESTIYIDKCDVQTYKIYTKLSELKNSSDTEEILENSK